MKSFKIDYIDTQFQEAVFFTEKLNLRLIEDASYSASFLDKLTACNFGSNNAIIILYDFDFHRKVMLSNSVKFLGAFDYLK